MDRDFLSIKKYTKKAKIFLDIFIRKVLYFMQNQRAQIVKKNKPEFVQSAENKERRGWSNARYGGGKEAQKVNQAIFHAGTMFVVCLYILVSSIAGMDLCLYRL